MKNTVVLVLVLFFASTCMAKPKEWQDATVTDVSINTVSLAAWGDTNITHYQVETLDTVYVLEYAFNPLVKLPFPGQHSRGRAPDLTVNKNTKIRIDGKNAHILDDSGRDVKMPIVKKIAKPETKN